MTTWPFLWQGASPFVHLGSASVWPLSWRDSQDLHTQVRAARSGEPTCSPGLRERTAAVAVGGAKSPEFRAIFGRFQVTAIFGRFQVTADVQAVKKHVDMDLIAQATV